MAQIKIENLTFTYPQGEKASVKDMSLEINKGEFIVVCGKSGCGKTTLLRCLKNSIAPSGKKEGEILLEGVDNTTLSVREEAGKIGFVFQHPQHQLVTDKVWHELAFGLENMGVKSGEMKLRVAETADYFGFSDKLYNHVETLSGGQKQLLNIAAVMVMQPEVIILDEPAAQLDPIAAEQLLLVLQKINRDFGTTIILSEHRLNRVFYMADKVLFMEEGKAVAWGEPRNVAMQLKKTEFFNAMPEAVKIYSEFEQEAEKCPLTIGEARRWISASKFKDEIYNKYEEESDNKKGTQADKYTETAIALKDIWFRYERNEADVIKGLSLNIKRGEIFGIVGGNGAGKSTLLSIMCKGLKPYRGKIKSDGFVSMLVQDVQCLFLKDSVIEEMETMSNHEKISEMLQIMELEEKKEMHPYDLSGGEQQRLGMSKLLLNEPDIILLDEPTKGMDEIWKEKFADILVDLKKKGRTVVIVSHDIEFLSQYADRCGMFFDGDIISVEKSRKFFRNNRFYTTEREKILRK